MLKHLFNYKKVEKGQLYNFNPAPLFPKGIVLIVDDYYDTRNQILVIFMINLDIDVQENSRTLFLKY